MSKSLFKFLILPVILLHFAGVTQLVSSVMRDQGSFVSMLNMTEEENKKETQLVLMPMLLKQIRMQQQKI
jgi:hypothetical protein